MDATSLVTLREYSKGTDRLMLIVRMVSGADIHGTMLILRVTLAELERPTEMRKDEPAFKGLKVSLVSAMAELSVVRDPLLIDEPRPLRDAETKGEKLHSSRSDLTACRSEYDRGGLSIEVERFRDSVQRFSFFPLHRQNILFQLDYFVKDRRVGFNSYRTFNIK